MGSRSQFHAIDKSEHSSTGSAAAATTTSIPPPSRRRLRYRKEDETQLGVTQRTLLLRLCGSGAPPSHVPALLSLHRRPSLPAVQPPHMIFTGLEDYKARGTQASPYYTITHFTEFAETKDTVLVRGDVVFTSKLTDAEAKRLLETAHSFYLNDVRYKLVERFNKETHDFEFKDVLEALEMPSM
ncbi:ATP synthase mitochondrial F1 complex assembly factor 1 [Hordeum vulgare]|nr:ATP synthase mitochondrial F1 complex assembly factor 1 [Hordeum vulgare]